MSETQNQGGSAKAQTVDTEKQIKELQKQLKESKKEKEALEVKLNSIDTQEKVAQVSPELELAFEQLQEKIARLEAQAASPVQVANYDGKRPKYKTPAPSDILPDGESVTFTTRSVMKIIASYIDENGIEQLPPFRLITFKFAAADIRQDGKEEEIINFANFTTNFKPEVEYLRNHPEYRITFSENMNDVAAYDPKEDEFKSKIASDVASMSMETVLQHAQVYNIPNRDKLTVKQLRPLIAKHIVGDYMIKLGNLRDEMTKNRELLKQKIKE